MQVDCTVRLQSQLFGKHAVFSFSWNEGADVPVLTVLACRDCGGVSDAALGTDSKQEAVFDSAH